MGLFKILGGVALGVGAVAAAPFTGGGSILGAATIVGSLAGAGTVAAAVGAGAAGAAAGYALNKKDEEEQKKSVDHARKEGKLAGEKIAQNKYEQKLRDAQKNIVEWRNQFEQAKMNTEEWQAYGKQITAMFGVGLAVAYIDGQLAPEEQEEIDEFTFGASTAALPQSAVQAIKALEKNPPSFEDAIKRAQEAGVQRPVIDSIIEAIANADHNLAPSEEALLSDWHNMSYRIN